MTVAQIPQYIRELTPVLLRSDTRVTNNGFFDGRPAPRQAVLEADTAVLVDGYGVPRTRCACGNPVTHPIPTRTTPTYTGDQWTRFTPQTTVVVQPPAQPITIIILIDSHRRPLRAPRRQLGGPGQTRRADPVGHLGVRKRE